MSKKAALLIIFFVFVPVVFSQNNPCRSQQNCLNTADIFKKSFEYGKAAEVIKKLNSEDTPRLSLYLAKLLYLNGESKEALARISALPKSWDAYLYLGLIYEDLGRIDEAADSYYNSLGRHKNSIALFRLGKIYRQRNENDKAAGIFRELIDFDSSIRLAYYYLGQCLMRSGHIQPAYRNLAKAISFYPGNKKMEREFKEVKRSLGEDFFLKKRKLKKEERARTSLPAYLRQKEILKVRVGVGLDLEKVTFSCPVNFRIEGKDSLYQGKPDIFYTFASRGSKLCLSSGRPGKGQVSFMPPVKITSPAKSGRNFPFYILDVSYGAGDFWHKKIDRAYRGDFELFLAESRITLVNIVSLEEYLYGVLAAEIPPGSPREALKAQAVLARSLAVRNKRSRSREKFDLSGSIYHQVYQGLSAETASTKEAVDATRGEVVFYRGKIPGIFYHSNCGGCLSSDTFGVTDYLASGLDSRAGGVPKSGYGSSNWFIDYPPAFCRDEKSAKFRWQRIYDREDFRLAFGKNLKDLEMIMPREKKQCFRQGKIDIVLAGETVSLEKDIAIRNYFDHLRSSAFFIEIKKGQDLRPEMLIFWGAGFGHGSGLCQEGAIGMAEEGYGYREIISHYYPGTKIGRLY